MAFQYSTTLRDNQLDQISATLGASGLLKIFSGAEPANVAAADPAGLLCTITMTSGFAAAANGSKAMSGTWSATASATGTAASFRMYTSGGTCHVQGNVTTDLVLNNTSITNGQTVSVTAFNVTCGNA